MTRNKSKETVGYGLETIFYRRPLFWTNLLEEYKFANSLSKLKSKIKS